MKKTTAAITFLAGLAGGMTSAAIPAHAATAATACTTSITHSHTVSSRGTVSDRTTLKEKCGTAYQVWAHGWTHSYTGASSTWHSYKNGLHCPGRWSAEKWTHSVSKSGSVRNTVTISSGTC